MGYHGNITAFLAKDWELTAKQFREKDGFTEQQIEMLHKRFVTASKLEEQYFSTIGVSQDLFDRTQSDDKGMGDGQSYSFLCPKPQTFERYGIKNVFGQQDINFGKEFGLKNILD